MINRRVVFHLETLYAQQMLHPQIETHLSLNQLQRLMTQAAEEAKTGIENGDGGPFGACIVQVTRKNNEFHHQIIGQGHNRVLSSHHTYQHGEIDAILNTPFHTLQGQDPNHIATLLFTTGQPCPMCAGVFAKLKIDVVYAGNTYEETANIGFSDAAIQAELKRPPAQRKIPIEPLTNTPPNPVTIIHNHKTYTLTQAEYETLNANSPLDPALILMGRVNEDVQNFDLTGALLIAKYPVGEDVYGACYWANFSKIVGQSEHPRRKETFAQVLLPNPDATAVYRQYKEMPGAGNYNSRVI